jgi:hypothetical protein
LRDETTEERLEKEVGKKKGRPPIAPLHCPLFTGSQALPGHLKDKSSGLTGCPKIVILK